MQKILQLVCDANGDHKARPTLMIYSWYTHFRAADSNKNHSHYHHCRTKILGQNQYKLSAANMCVVIWNCCTDSSNSILGSSRQHSGISTMQQARLVVDTRAFWCHHDQHHRRSQCLAVALRFLAATVGFCISPPALDRFSCSTFGQVHSRWNRS